MVFGASRLGDEFSDILYQISITYTIKIAFIIFYMSFKLLLS
jgi:hypothetical protein